VICAIATCPAWSNASGDAGGSHRSSASHVEAFDGQGDMVGEIIPVGVAHRARERMAGDPDGGSNGLGAHDASGVKSSGGPHRSASAA
ncbi:MAG: hypothetical protein ACN6OP_13795, partial [Pseudomonadales bacterium]